jgi:hypothetical protein
VIDLPAVWSGFFIGVPCATRAVTKLAAPRGSAIMLILAAVVLSNLAPYVLWHTIDHYVLVTRRSALSTDCD